MKYANAGFRVNMKVTLKISKQRSPLKACVSITDTNDFQKEHDYRRSNHFNDIVKIGFYRICRVPEANSDRAQ